MTMLTTAASQQSPAQKRALGFKQLFEAAFASPKLAAVKGNILVFVPNVATWTLITTGPHRGLKDYATDDEVHFAMSCDDLLLVQLMTGADVDFRGAVASGRLKLEGDVNVFLRFVDCIPT